MFNKTIKESTIAYGKENQCIVLYEELSELEQAICKILRYGWQGDDKKHDKIRDNFIEEMVDVFYMTEWFYSEILNIELNKTSFELFNENWSSEEILKELISQISFAKNDFNDMILFNTFESNQEDQEEYEETDFLNMEILYRMLICIVETFSDSSDKFFNFVTLEKAQAWALYKHERNVKTMKELEKNK